jgi:putative peptide zinc metalloprotease protein
MFAIVPTATITEFDIAPAGQYLLRTPRGRFVLSAPAVDLIRALEGASSVDALGGSSEEIERAKVFLTAHILPTGVFGDVDIFGNAAPASMAGPRRPAYAPGVRPLLALTSISRSTELLKHLFRPGLAVSLVLSSIAAQAVFFWAHRRIAWEQVSPEAYALAGLLCFLTLPFHELGHGAACRHYKTSHGAMGFAMYYVFPRFYTDTSETWSLGRWRRVVVDLGGVYFQLLAASVFALMYLGTGQAAWGPAVWMVDVSILYNLKPYLRVDGYWILTDIAGILDPYQQVKEYLQHLLSRRDTAARPRPMLGRVSAWLRWFTVGYVTLVGALSVWVVAFFIWKTVTVVLPAYPGVLRALVFGPRPEGVLHQALKALGQTVLLGTFSIFVWNQGRRVWRWLSPAAGRGQPLVDLAQTP